MCWLAHQPTQVVVFLFVLVFCCCEQHERETFRHSFTVEIALRLFGVMQSGMFMNESVSRQDDGTLHRRRGIFGYAFLLNTLFFQPHSLGLAHSIPDLYIFVSKFLHRLTPSNVRPNAGEPAPRMLHALLQIPITKQIFAIIKRRVQCPSYFPPHGSGDDANKLSGYRRQ